MVLAQLQYYQHIAKIIQLLKLIHHNDKIKIDTHKLSSLYPFLWYGAHPSAPKIRHQFEDVSSS